jgi:hypothetical protein
VIVDRHYRRDLASIRLRVKMLEHLVTRKLMSNSVRSPLTTPASGTTASAVYIIFVDLLVVLVAMVLDEADRRKQLRLPLSLATKLLNNDQNLWMSLGEAA